MSGTVSVVVVIVVIAFALGMIWSGWKSIVSFVIVGMFLGASGMGVAVKNGLVTGVKAGGNGISNVVEKK
jgi:hypothetical protein